MPADNFTYHSRPVVTGLNPSVGLAEGGDSVTVSGSGFSTMPGATSITFGGAAAGSVSCPSTTQCTATSPPGIGTVSVLVTVGGQTSADTPADNFTYLPFGPAPRSSGPAVAPGFGAAPAAPLTPPTGRRGG
jgi:hypothetical protein